MSLEEQIQSAVKAAVAPLVAELEDRIGQLVRVSAEVQKARYSDDTLLNEEQVAEYTGIKPKTLQQWRSGRKNLPFIKIGGAARYLFGDVRRFVAENKQRVTDDNGRIL
ncbi:helix-turn-helix domain-containing protein [Geovibrio ferrireducens]|uniref:helix-turn-helix domain-containing protein n=1 Tax=Geovibrio ferrireducens TaxID=46201 RepID=UPI00224846E1|nr:helix-turn-helix domain-containing protein [Geovibrio ferrireducens]